MVSTLSASPIAIPSLDPQVWVPILVSWLSLLVAFFTLYLDHIKSADVVVATTHLKNRTDSRIGGRNGIWPDPITIFYKLYIENLGGRSGSFEGVEVSLHGNGLTLTKIIPENSLRSTDLDSNNNYKPLPERLVLQDKAIIPVMLAVSVRYVDTEQRSQENFLAALRELKRHRSDGQPTLRIRYVVKEHKDPITRIFESIWRRKGQKEEITLSNLAGDIIGVLMGPITDVHNEVGNRDYQISEAAIEVINQ